MLMFPLTAIPAISSRNKTSQTRVNGLVKSEWTELKWPLVDSGAATVTG